MDPRCLRAKSGILSAIGDTPLIELRRHVNMRGGRLYAKLESHNPGGSAKDRPARQMIESALLAGTINSASTVIESTSGNMGIGLAQVCRYYGLRLICVVDPRAQSQNLSILRAYGAEVDVVREPIQGDFLRARLSRVCHLLETIPNSYWPNQYANADNPRAHQSGTIREIDEQLDGEYDFLFVAVSSTGTIRGCRELLREKDRKAKLVAVDAEGSILFGGKDGPRLIPGLGAGLNPPLARGQEYETICRVKDSDSVVECRRLAHREAILAGGSSGAVLAAIRSMPQQIAGKTVVAILHDSGTRYLDTIFNDAWVHEKLGVTPSMLASEIDLDKAYGACAT